MSETSSLTRLPSPTRIRAEHHIVLVDHTSSQVPSYQGETPAELSDSDTPAGGPGPGTLYKRLTNSSTGLRQSVRQGYNKQKYARYGQDRYHVNENLAPEGSEETAGSGGSGAGSGVSDSEEPKAIQRDGSYLGRAQTNLERAQSRLQSKAKGVYKRKKNLGKGDEEDTVIDILYENQRGMFFFGIPKYSSASLLPSDPKPWQNGQFRTSAVDIRNAQVPDPSWEWAWKSWYVDMSRDVDEEGWEYSFAFFGRAGATFAWHGNHPWFHSFVRRRRWLRMRKRKSTVHRTQEKAHELTSDYFTIHPKTISSANLLSRNASSTLVNKLGKVGPVVDVEKMDIMNMGDLLLALRKSTVDREKLVAVRKFTDQGGEELYYLGERMEEIMGMLIFQSSRRQLLSDLISRHEQLRGEQEDLAEHEHGNDLQLQQEHDRKARHASNLRKAIHVAEDQVKKLEYWSDIRGVTSTGDAGQQHIEPSFKNKQPASAGTPNLPNGKGKGADTAFEIAKESDSRAPSKKSSIWYDTESKKTKSSKGKDSSAGGDTEPDGFVLAPEEHDTASQNTRSTTSKGKARVTNLDGVAEAAAEDEDKLGELVSPTTGARGVGSRRSVQIVEPIALDYISEHSPTHFSNNPNSRVFNLSKKTRKPAG